MSAPPARIGTMPLTMAGDLNALLVLAAVVVASTFFTEVLLWAWAFRKSSFQTLKDQVERQVKKTEGPAAPGKKQKKADRMESNLKDAISAQMAKIRLKQAVVMGVSLLVLFRYLNSWYDGKNLARLPFEPPSLIRKLSQRNLDHPRLDDCAFALMYTILNVGIRPNISKLLDVGPSRKMLELSAFAPPQQ